MDGYRRRAKNITRARSTTAVVGAGRDGHCAGSSSLNHRNQNYPISHARSRYLDARRDERLRGLSSGGVVGLIPSTIPGFSSIHLANSPFTSSWGVRSTSSFLVQESLRRVSKLRCRCGFPGEEVLARFLSFREAYRSKVTVFPLGTTPSVKSSGRSAGCPPGRSMFPSSKTISPGRSPP